MLWKLRMRLRTDQKESSRSKSTASKALEWSSSATLKGEGDRRPPTPERYRSAPADDRAVQPKGPGRGERSPARAGENRQEYLQAHVQLWEERSQLGHPRKTSRMTDRTSPGGEKKDQVKETDPQDASSTLHRSHCWTSDGNAC